METEGLNAVAENPSTPFYGTETLGDVDYFTAVYADVAVAMARVATMRYDDEGWVAPWASPAPLARTRRAHCRPRRRHIACHLPHN